MTKIQTLAIILIIIIIPISFALSIYTKSQVDTLSLQREYDKQLQTATYDALKAFQINEANNTISQIANSTILDLEASINAFFNSLKTVFALQGYDEEALKEYVPALVYTLHDGYYIYSPYSNVASVDVVDDETGEKGVIIDKNDKSNVEYGLKPYVYYSCRYIKGNDDFVITYSLDNYIDIKGIINGNYVSDAGYILSEVVKDGENYKYDGVTIETETVPMKEYVGDTAYEYIKFKGVKRYLDEVNGEIFVITNGNKVIQAKKDSTTDDEYWKYYDAIKNNSIGLKYYEDAYNFTQRVLETYGLKNLEVSDAVISTEGTTIKFTDNGKIFSTDIPLEYSTSNFNKHRKEVIRYSIESNLSVAIANFNRYTQNTSFDYQMPVLNETDWDLLSENVSIITFLQGLNIGNKAYNGYSVVTNAETENLIREEDIYIVEDYTGENTGVDKYYHRIEDHLSLTDGNITENSKGVLDVDFQRKSINSSDNAYLIYYYPRRELACYDCIVSQNEIGNKKYTNVYEYLNSISSSTLKNKLKKIYYTALGRERYGIGLKFIGLEFIGIED